MRQSLPREEPDPGLTLSDSVVAEVLREHPELAREGFLCRADLNRYRARYVHALLEAERGEVTSIEQEVAQSLANHEVLAKNVDAEVDEQWSRGDRLADRVATSGGSWRFLGVFALFLALWVLANGVVLAQRPPDPYPFILLNLFLSCLAATQAPVIMMSQNRQEAKDRRRAQHDYPVNLKAELEIRHLNEKVDHLLSHQFDRLARIQEIG